MSPPWVSRLHTPADVFERVVGGQSPVSCSPATLLDECGALNFEVHQASVQHIFLASYSRACTTSTGEYPTNFDMAGLMAIWVSRHESIP